MFIQRIHKKTKNKTYTSVVLMENYREGPKVKHRIISNLSKWPKDLICNFEKLLKGQGITTISDLRLSQGKAMGGLFAVKEISKRLGIYKALGRSRHAKLALFQIAGRVIKQASRNYLANEWVQNQAVERAFKLNKFNEDTLYDNLDWLAENQQAIEQRIFKNRLKGEAVGEIFLYDVTSSYLEGEKNELAYYGYNRDKKKGKKQIVIGLLTDKQGYPLSVEVFKGNTADPTTVINQLQKLKDNFGVERVVFVGDKGMIKSSQIKDITSDTYKWNYLTTITKEQIRTLIKNDILQLELFDDDVTEVETGDGIRYILRKNKMREKEIQENRQSKIKNIASLVNVQTAYLKEHGRAKTEVALKNINTKISKLKIGKILSLTLNERTISLNIDELALQKKAELDGCYVVKTDVPNAKISTRQAHDRYKDLANVEFAFRTMKTTIEELRPIYVRKEKRTRGHVFVVMLAYMIIKYITDELSELGYTRKFIIESLDKIHYLQYIYKGKVINVVPDNLLPHQKKIVQKLNLTLKT